MIRLRKITTLLFLLGSTGAMAQQFSLKEAVDYAISHHVQVKNAQLDVLSAQAKVNEIRAIGLPQVNANVSLNQNLIIQKVFIPAKTFNPLASEGEVTSVEFGVKHIGNSAVSMSQLLFDGSYLLGLKASAVYKELSQKTLTQTKQQIAENVTKAYYGILVNEKRMGLLDINISRLDSMLKDTRALNKAGFAEKIDVQRLEVQANNLRTERDNLNRLQTLSYSLLKFQMSYPMEEPIALSEKLEMVQLQNLQNQSGAFDYANRIEYSMLQTQENLAELDVKAQKSGYLPRLSFIANYGYNAGRKTFSDLIGKQWFDNSLIGFSLQVPIFDGFSKKYKIIQSENTLKKVRQSYDLLKSSIDIQRNQSIISLKNALESLREQQSNLELANEISRVSRVKYQQGVGSSLEVLNAEASIKESQINYFTALYNALIAKVELEKANGTLYNE